MLFGGVHGNIDAFGHYGINKLVAENSVRRWGRRREGEGEGRGGGKCITHYA